MLLVGGEHDVSVFLPVDVPLIDAETLRRLAAQPANSATVVDVDEFELTNVNSPSDLAALESRRAARGGPSHRGAEI